MHPTERFDRRASVLKLAVEPWQRLGFSASHRYQLSLIVTHAPLEQSDGHEAPWLIGEAVRGEAAMVEDVVVGFEDAVRQPVVAPELPDVLDGVELIWGITRELLCYGGILDLLRDTVIVSDGASQFRVGDHALCWVHADQLVHKLQPLCAAHRRVVDLKRSLIWWFYADPKAYQRDPDPRRGRGLRMRFDRIFTNQTGYVMLDRQLARLHKLKPDLLCVLDRPEIPLHTNGYENDNRTVVTKRKISGGTVSEAGKTARDTMLGLLNTCSKLDISYYQLLGDRFAVPGITAVAPLQTLVSFAKA